MGHADLTTSTIYFLKSNEGHINHATNICQMEQSSDKITVITIFRKREMHSSKKLSCLTLGTGILANSTDFSALRHVSPQNDSS